MLTYHFPDFILLLLMSIMRVKNIYINIFQVFNRKLTNFLVSSPDKSDLFSGNHILSTNNSERLKRTSHERLFHPWIQDIRFYSCTIKNKKGHWPFLMGPHFVNPAANDCSLPIRNNGDIPLPLSSSVI